MEEWQTYLSVVHQKDEGLTLSLKPLLQQQMLPAIKGPPSLVSIKQHLVLQIDKTSNITKEKERRLQWSIKNKKNQNNNFFFLSMDNMSQIRSI